MTRFDLEQAIMQLWSTADDIKTLYDYHDTLSADDLANALLGLQQLANLRGQKALDLFEQFLKEER